MKKLFIAMVILLVVSGCSQKPKTAAEIYRKVQENASVSEYVTINSEGEMKVEVQGVSMEIPISIRIDGDNLSNPSQRALYSQTQMEILGEEATISLYFVDDVLYIDDGVVRKQGEMGILSELDDLMNLQSYEIKDEAINEVFEFEIVEDGYLLKAVLTSDELNATSELDEYFDLIGTEMQFESAELSFHISNEYQLVDLQMKLQMKIEVAGEVVAASVDTLITVEQRSQAQIELPDFTNWGYKRMACVVDGQPEEPNVIFVEAQGDTVDVLGFSYWYFYEDYGLTKPEDKAYLKSLLEDYYSPYVDLGLKVNIQDEDEEELILSFSVDYQTASLKLLELFGISGGLTYTELFGDTSGMDCTDF